ncbi:mraW methylase family protein [Bordetella holmesii 44057]|nr:mraW methylase family protein [Bordetella holmesii 44057]
MDTSRGPTVAEWLAQASVEEMREVIADYGEERFAFQVAKAIAARCATRPLRTTLELAECVASAVRTREKGQHPATRTFQALRIYINRELEELARALASAIELLAPGGGWQ